MNTTQFRGHWPAMITPMHDDGRLRLESVPLLVEKFVREGAGGVYVGGSTGQGPLLTSEERKALTEAAVEAAAGRLPVMIHVGSIRLEETIDLARHAETAGADAVSSVPPMYYPPTLRSTLEHYRRIAGAIELPFYAYNFAVPNCPLPEYVEALLSVPNLRGLKFTNRDTYELALLKIHSAGRLNVLSGADETFLAAQAQGADGSIGSTQNVALPLFNAVAGAAEAGRWREARERMLDLVRLVQDVTISQGVASLHHLLTDQGIPCGQPRHPMPACDEAGRAAARAVFREIMSRRRRS